MNKTLENIRQSKRRRLVRIRSAIILACGIVCIGLAGLPLANNMQKTNEINELHAKAASELETLEDERKQLEYRVSLLEDEEYIAKLARKELNLSKEEEILINLPEADDTQHADELEDSEKSNKEENESE